MLNAIKQEIIVTKDIVMRVEVLPSREDLARSFPHKEGCLQNIPLVEDKILFSHGSGLEPAIFGSGLTCNSCHVSRRYREE